MRIGLRGREADNGANGRTNEAQTRFSDAAAFCRHFFCFRNGVPPEWTVGFREKRNSARFTASTRDFFLFFAEFSPTSPQISPNGGKTGERGRFYLSRAERG